MTRASRPRMYGLRRALDQSRTSGISRSEVADGSLALVRFALVWRRRAGANDPDDIIGLHLNVHHEQKSRSRRRAEDQQPVFMGQIGLDQRMFIVEHGSCLLERDRMLSSVRRRLALVPCETHVTLALHSDGSLRWRHSLIRPP